MQEGLGLRSADSAPSSGNLEVFNTAEGDGFKVENLAYPRLGGAKDYQAAANVHFANQASVRLEQVRITLNGGEAIAESETLHFMVGRIDLEIKIECSQW